MLGTNSIDERCKCISLIKFDRNFVPEVLHFLFYDANFNVLKFIASKAFSRTALISIKNTCTFNITGEKKSLD